MDSHRIDDFIAVVGVLAVIGLLILVPRAHAEKMDHAANYSKYVLSMEG